MRCQDEIKLREYALKSAFTYRKQNKRRYFASGLARKPPFCVLKAVDLSVKTRHFIPPRVSAALVVV